MKTTQAHKSPPGASGDHSDQVLHGLASPSIRPNLLKTEDRGLKTEEYGVAALLVGCIAVELTLFGWVVTGIIKP